MRLTILDYEAAERHGHWVEVHAVGCRHVRGPRGGERGHHFEADSVEEAARWIGRDFINEGSMSFEAVLAQIHFAPCLRSLYRDRRGRT